MEKTEITDPNFLVKAPKKPRTEKQKIATENALKALKERREKLQAEKEAKKKAEQEADPLRNTSSQQPVEPYKEEKPKRSHKAKKVDFVGEVKNAGFLTKSDMDSYLSRIEQMIAVKKEPVIVKQEAPKPEPVPKVVEPVVKQWTPGPVSETIPPGYQPQPVRPKPRNGRELLDQLLFNR